MLALNKPELTRIKPSVCKSVLGQDIAVKPRDNFIIKPKYAKKGIARSKNGGEIF